MNTLRLLAVVALLAPSAASADVAPPPVESLECPVGAVGRVDDVDPDARDPRGRPLQAWPYCAPSQCASNADCVGGRVCSSAEIGLCVIEQERDDGSVMRSVRDRPCEPDGTCLNIHAECRRARRCVDPSEEPAPEPGDAPAEETADDTSPAAPVAQAAGGCACGVTPPGAPVSSALLALLAGLLIRRR